MDQSPTHSQPVRHGGHRISKPDRQVPKIVRDATSGFIKKYSDALRKLEKL